MKTLIIKDLSHTARELEQKEMAHIAGGRIDDGNRPPVEPDNGVCWVPAGTIKFIIGGVETSPFGG